VKTSLIAPVAAARDLVLPWHETYEPWARQGIAPHVTLLSPFLSSDRINPEVEDRIAGAVSGCVPLDVVFDRVKVLPGAICMFPLDGSGLRRVTAAILRSWPTLSSTLRTGRSRPYHLTVACTEDHQIYDEIRATLDPLLPITTKLDAIQLVAHDERNVHPLTTIRVAHDPVAWSQAPATL
jgi:2'-5' RNA ligase superfamily